MSSRSYQEWLIAKLGDPAFVVEYLNEHMCDDGEGEGLFLEALRNVARAAKRADLCRMTSIDVKLSTLVTLLRVVGLRLSVARREPARTRSRSRSQIGPRTAPPTDEEVADPNIVAWQFQSFDYADHGSAHDHAGRAAGPRLLQVLFIGEGEPRAFEPGREQCHYFRTFKREDGQTVNPGYGWIEGYWRPVYAPASGAR